MLEAVGVAHRVSCLPTKLIGCIGWQDLRSLVLQAPAHPDPRARIEAFMHRLQGGRDCRGTFLPRLCLRDAHTRHSECHHVQVPDRECRLQARRWGSFPWRSCSARGRVTTTIAGELLGFGLRLFEAARPVAALPR